jgi:hypothetical protein
MKKVINVKPLTEIELQFEDGKCLSLIFDVEALLRFNNIAEDFYKDTSTPEICAKIVYIGAKTITIEESRAIVSSLDPGTIIEIITEFNESMGVAQNGVQKEYAKKMIAQFLNSAK